MRVLFIFPDLAPEITNHTGALSPGLAVLSALLKQQGHAVSLYHMTSTPDQEEFTARVQAVSPDLVAFSVNSHYARRLPTWCRWSKAACGSPITVGGIHPTLVPEQVAAIPEVDFTCRGEGEHALIELCVALEEGRDTTHIKNLWVGSESGIVENPQRPLCPDLDELPEPDYSLFDFPNLYNVRRGMFTFMMSRGCLFQCTYCCIHKLRDLSCDDDKFWRFMSPQHAVKQLRVLLDRHHPTASQVKFVDTVFFPNPQWLREFAPLYKELIGLPFSCNMRADFVTPETAAIMADMGCEVVRLGVESGDEQLTREILRRGLTIDNIRRAFALLAEHGIARWSYNMVGLPEENLNKALKTVALNADLQPDLALPFIFYPYPGTQLFEICNERGYLTDKEFDNYMIGVPTNMPAFPKYDILFVQRFFGPLVRLFSKGRNLPGPLGLHWDDLVASVLTSRLFPRSLLVRTLEFYKKQRTRAGGYLVHRSPKVYRFLGGTDPL